MKKLTTEQFIEKAKKVHGNKYRYNKVVYKKAKEKISITCALHGDFSQTPDKHLGGQGCPKCAGVQKSTLLDFTTKANNIHKNKYSYKNTEYTKNHEEVNITCLVHGDFKQLPSNHLRGHGCPKCGNESHWKRSDYIRKANGRICTFYTLRCFNETEEFYKIGITMNSVDKRYCHISRMPYSYEVISEIKGEAGFILDLEKDLKAKLKSLNYQPKIKFKGSKTECFTQYKI